MFIGRIIRLFSVGMLLAIKFHDDLHLSNEDFAKVGGVSLDELNILELEMLGTLEFDLTVETEVFFTYLVNLSGPI